MNKLLLFVAASLFAFAGFAKTSESEAASALVSPSVSADSNDLPYVDFAIVQKRNRIQSDANTLLGCDTVFRPGSGPMRITLTMNLPVTDFGGSYLVERIPYNPPESFSEGSKLPVSVDDVWDNAGGLDINFPFSYFGQPQTHVTVGGNGLVKFGYATGGTGYSWNSRYPINPSSTNPIPTDSFGNTFYNAILACASDTDPGRITTNAEHRGIFKYSGGEYPKRHICFSWNEVPVFGGPFSYGHGCAVDDNSYVCTHQVVFYEGTSVIEVHVQKHYSHGTAGNQTSGLGIVNSNGTSAFMVPSWNPLWYNSSLHTNGSNINNCPSDRCIDPSCPECSPSEAWRFTPVGSTIAQLRWYKLEDTTLVQILHLSEYEDMGVQNPEEYLMDLDEEMTGLADTVLYASPSAITTYVCQMSTISMGGGQYVFFDTLVVGVPDPNMRYGISLSVDDSTRGTAVSDSADYLFGTEAVVSAIAYQGYRFDRWSDGNTDNPRTLTIVSDTSLMAMFVRDSNYFEVRVSANYEDRGHVMGGGFVEYMGWARVTAACHPGYHFEMWSDGSTLSDYSFQVTEDVDLMAIFLPGDSVGISRVDKLPFQLAAAGREIVIKGVSGMNVEVFDAIGRMIYGTKRSDDELHISPATSGCYVVRVGGYPAQKVVLLR